MFLAPLVHRFWKLTLQILSRLNSHLAGLLKDKACMHTHTHTHADATHSCTLLVLLMLVVGGLCTYPAVRYVRRAYSEWCVPSSALSVMGIFGKESAPCCQQSDVTSLCLLINTFCMQTSVMLRVSQCLLSTAPNSGVDSWH